MTDRPRAGSAVRAVRVPATTSNLGPGFDFLGLALSLWLEVRAAPSGDREHALVDAQGSAGEWPPPATNLLFRAFDRARSELGLTQLGLRVEARSEIPISRGLGSSGAAIAAGLALGAGWEEPASVARHLEELVAIGSELEGHPDNSTASLCGGCTLALPSANGLRILHHRVHPSIGFAVAWPGTPVPTAPARAALPDRVAFADAVENPRRLAALLAGLDEGDPGLIAHGVEDRLHVRHRLPLIPGGAETLGAAREAGAWAATVSGSGSTLIALGPRAAMEPIAGAMIASFERAGERASGRVVEPVFSPLEVHASN